MKKYLCTLMIAIITMFMAIPANAQMLKFGLKGGVNLSELDTNIKSIKENSLGYFIGPMMEFTFPGVGLGADVAVMYAQRGKDEFKMEGIEVPLNVKVTIGVGGSLSIFLAAGPDFFLNLKDIDLLAIRETVDGYEAKDKKAQVGLNLGGGIKLMRHLQIGVNYQLPLGESFTFKRIGDAMKEDAKYNIWQVSLAYTF